MQDQQSIQYKLLKISGEDSANFLQGQLSNDVLQLDQGWQYSGLCNPKGRLLAMFRLWKFQQDYYALLPGDLTGEVVDRLGKYVLRSKVKIEIVEQVLVFAFAGLQQLRQFDPKLTSTDTQNKQLVLQRVNENGNNFFALVADHGILFVTSEADLERQPLSALTNEWHDNCIDAGVPEITQSTTELFVPQMINLDLIGGIDFKKGCYTGQEIVARLHYLGNLKQRMLLCTVGGEPQRPLAMGDKTFSDGELSKNSGRLISISHDGRRALAVLKVALLEQQHYLENGQQLNVARQQPYEVVTSG